MPSRLRKEEIVTAADGIMDHKAMQLFRACLRRPALLHAIEAECDAQVRWVLQQPAVVSAIVGAKRVEQLDAIVASLD